MEINELKAIHLLQQKSDRPIYLGYVKSKSGKRSVGYMDPLYAFKLLKIHESQDPQTNLQGISRMWNLDNFKPDPNYKYLVELIKPDTGGKTYVFVEDVFLQNEKQYQKIKVLYGS